MNQDANLAQMNKQHRILESMIDKEAHRPNPDQMHLSDLKRQKLRLKEEIHELEHPQHETVM